MTKKLKRSEYISINNDDNVMKQEIIIDDLPKNKQNTQFKKDVKVNTKKVSIPSQKNLSGEKTQFKKIFQKNGKKTVKDVVIPPTIPPSTQDPTVIIKQIMQVVNKGKKVYMAQRMEYIGARLIQPGHIGIVQNNNDGKLNVVPPGRWGALNPYCKWRGIFPVSQERISVANLTIVNVQNGYFGLATNNTYPFVLGSGRHVYLSKVFTFDRQVQINQPHIVHKTIHILNVPKGRIARVSIDQIPYLIETGVHVFVSPLFQYVDMVNANLDLIIHGTITRFRVHLGKVCLCWDNQKPVFYTEPAIITKDSPNFRFVKSIDAKTKYYSLGARKNVTVWSGEIGISFKEGKLCILSPGFHQINDPNHIFDGFMSTRQRSIDLSRRNTDDFIECETKDLVKVGLKATLFYKVEEPKKAICEIGEEKEIETFLLDTAVACLNSIVRSTSLTEVARSVESPHQFKKGEDETQDKHPQEPSAPMFFDRAHDEFLFKLHDDFLKRYGLNIVDLRIESFKITSEELATQISKQAIVTAKTQTELANLEGQREIATSIQTRESEVQAIKNKILLDKVEMETQARTNKLVKEANAEAQRILIVAKAKAKAKEIQAKADFKYVQVMNQLPLGKEMALLQMKTEMIKEALKNTQKVVYMDSNNPLGFFQQLMKGIGGGFNKNETNVIKKETKLVNEIELNIDDDEDDLEK